jgi:hypothetical protein
MSASLIGRLSQGLKLRVLDRLAHPGVGHASLRSRTGPCRALHALVGRDGEPCFGARSKRSRQLRLLPDHRPRKRCSCIVGLARLTQVVASVALQRKSVPFIHIV